MPPLSCLGLTPCPRRRPLCLSSRLLHSLLLLATLLMPLLATLLMPPRSCRLMPWSRRRPTCLSSRQLLFLPLLERLSMPPLSCLGLTPCPRRRMDTAATPADSLSRRPAHLRLSIAATSAEVMREPGGRSSFLALTRRPALLRFSMSSRIPAAWHFACRMFTEGRHMRHHMCLMIPHASSWEDAWRRRHMRHLPCLPSAATWSTGSLLTPSSRTRSSTSWCRISSSRYRRALSTTSWT